MPNLDDPQIADKVDAVCDQLRTISNEALAEIQDLLRDAGLSHSAKVIDETRSQIAKAINTLRRRQFDYGRNTGLAEAALLADGWGECAELAKAIRDLWR